MGLPIFVASFGVIGILLVAIFFFPPKSRKLFLWHRELTASEQAVVTKLGIAFCVGLTVFLVAPGLLEHYGLLFDGASGFGCAFYVVLSIPAWGWYSRQMAKGKAHGDNNH